MRKRVKDSSLNRSDDLRQVFAIIAIILGLGAVTIVRVRSSMPIMVPVPPDLAAIQEGTTESSVRLFVEHFGVKLRDVTLSAPKALAAESIQANYSGIVWPDLLSVWMKDPAEAPGRLTSSPWPDHIDVASITLMNGTTYAVTGDVAEVTSNEIVNGGVADTYQIFLTVENSNGKWLITDYKDTLARN